MSTANGERPIALVVEDVPATLARRRELFARHGFQAIGAHSVEEALREFRGTPTIDIVVTDINLNPHNDSDKSGVDLARTMRDRRPKLPLVALSGHFDTLDADERSSFDDYLLKAAYSVKAFEGKLDVWRSRALEYRRQRAEKARAELARVRSEGTTTEPSVDVLRDFLPVGRDQFDRQGEPPFNAPDDILAREGWRLRLVDAGFSLADGTVSTAIAIPFWIRKEHGVAIVVLHGHSCIYNDSADEDDAISGALELMFGYFREFSRDSSSLSKELEELEQYLNRVFG